MPYKKSYKLWFEIIYWYVSLRKFSYKFKEVVKANTHEGFCSWNMLQAYFSLPVHTRGHTVMVLTWEQTKETLCGIADIHPSSETQGQSVGSGEKTGRKFLNTGKRASGYRLSPNYFQKIKRLLAPDWAQKNALYYCA